MKPGGPSPERQALLRVSNLVARPIGPSDSTVEAGHLSATPSHFTVSPVATSRFTVGILGSLEVTENVPVVGEVMPGKKAT